MPANDSVQFMSPPVLKGFSSTTPNTFDTSTPAPPKSPKNTNKVTNKTMSTKTRKSITQERLQYTDVMHSECYTNLQHRGTKTQILKQSK